jgi:hypothetical protein
VCGIAPFGEYLCLLAYIEEDENGRKVPQPPELRIITRHNEEISSDALTYVCVLAVFPQVVESS